VTGSSSQPSSTPKTRIVFLLCVCVCVCLSLSQQNIVCFVDVLWRVQCRGNQNSSCTAVTPPQTLAICSFLSVFSFFLSLCILEGVCLCAGGSLYLIYRTKSVVAAAGFLVGLGHSANPWSDSLRKDEPLFLSSLMQSSRSRWSGYVFCNLSRLNKVMDGQVCSLLFMRKDVSNLGFPSCKWGFVGRIAWDQNDDDAYCRDLHSNQVFVTWFLFVYFRDGDPWGEGDENPKKRYCKVIARLVWRRSSLSAPLLAIRR
jgi:hypothetical protein